MWCHLSKRGRNTGGRSFRELLREARLKKALKRLEENDVAGLYVFETHLRQAGDKALRDHTQDEFFAISNGFHLKDNIARLLPLLAGSTDDINALWSIIDSAVVLGALGGPFAYQLELRTKAARDARMPWWHSEARLLGVGLRQKYRTYGMTRIAKEVYAKLREKPNGPPTWEAVRGYLRREEEKERKKEERRSKWRRANKLDD
jgi:hypothetical protein